jgi:hypothetical protein
LVTNWESVSECLDDLRGNGFNSPLHVDGQIVEGVEVLRLRGTTRANSVLLA